MIASCFDSFWMGCSRWVSRTAATVKFEDRSIGLLRVVAGGKVGVEVAARTRRHQGVFDERRGSLGRSFVATSARYRGNRACIDRCRASVSTGRNDGARGPIASGPWRSPTRRSSRSRHGNPTGARADRVHPPEPLVGLVTDPPWPAGDAAWSSVQAAQSASPAANRMYERIELDVPCVANYRLA